MARVILIWFLLEACVFGKPNVVVVLVDDMGFSDVGCYGGEIETPNLDALAAGGVRFSDFHNTGRCCPTRASLLTGLYPHQAGVGWMTADWGKPGYRGFINRESVTLGEVLGDAGYFTAMTGKWHVGDKDGQRPAQRGFERSYCVPEGGGFYFQVKKGRSVRKNDVVVASGGKVGSGCRRGGMRRTRGWRRGWRSSTRRWRRRSRFFGIWRTTRRISRCRRRRRRSRSTAAATSRVGTWCGSGGIRRSWNRRCSRSRGSGARGM